MHAAGKSPAARRLTCEAGGCSFFLSSCTLGYTGCRVSKKKPKADRPRWKGPWLIHFFKRHVDDHPTQSVPGREFLDSCPKSVRAKLSAIIKAVADAPPPMFSGGGKWEAMHGDMSGFYEARTDGENREHFRLFCVLERDGASIRSILTGERSGEAAAHTRAALDSWAGSVDAAVVGIGT